MKQKFYFKISIDKDIRKNQDGIYHGCVSVSTGDKFHHLTAKFLCDAGEDYIEETEERIYLVKKIECDVSELQEVAGNALADFIESLDETGYH